LSFFIKSPQIFYQISTSYGVHITILHEGTTSIDKFAFYQDISLQYIVIPKTITDIDEYALFLAAKVDEAVVLETIYYGGDNKTQWDAININETNKPSLEGTNIVYYSETSKAGCWHWKDAAKSDVVMW
jgi:hypothetical protein